MYVCRTLDKTVTVIVFDDVVEGVCEMIPAPNLLADPSRPRQSSRRAIDCQLKAGRSRRRMLISQVGARGDGFFRLPDACACVMVAC